jgi:hypothetical protein
MPAIIPVLLSDLECRAVLEAINRAWDHTPRGTPRRAIDRAASRIEEALRRHRAGRIPERAGGGSAQARDDDPLTRSER